MIKLATAGLAHLKKVPDANYFDGQALYHEGSCQILSQSPNVFDVLITHHEEDVEVRIEGSSGELKYYLNGKSNAWDAYGIAALMQVKDTLKNVDSNSAQLPGHVYTRKGMVKRVLNERREKADKEDYKITFAKNIYGEHILTNKKGTKYRITLRDFKSETGYIDNPDLKTNKLGTTKHIMYAFAKLKLNRRLYKKLGKTYPFVEVYLDPLNDYRITWHYPHTLKPEIASLIRKYFGKNNDIPEEAVKNFLGFIRDARQFPQIVVRREVEEKVKKAWDRETLQHLSRAVKPDFSCIKVKLFPYQREGVSFATFRESAVIADEMGLGKTIQAIATAVMKKAIFGFRRTLVICPASLKEQWKQEIMKFSHEDAVVVSGLPEQRAKTYRESTAFFLIVNYETVLRDWREMNRMNTDFIILDEAQKIKNFSTLTAQSIKLLEKKHALVITGTPIENRLIDLYSIIQFADPHFLAPLWEFSYQHCHFDKANRNKVTGYYNLQNLKERLKSLLIRREKSRVLKDLPKVTEITVPIVFHEEQQMYHASCAKGIASILSKKYISPYDLQKLMLLMANMRMVCDSTYLVDKESNISPKLKELREILLEKLDLPNSKSKVIIFSEWVTMLNLIGKMLHECGIGFAQLSGKVAVKNRDKLVKKFETDPQCKVFLSTEAGGSGLNLQVADTVVNFELPWNPAKKNQRIGRIDRLGQRSKKLTVINFITRDSIETNIASGLLLKQNLFDGVLDSNNSLDTVDFSASGKAQFLQQLEKIMEGFTRTETVQEEQLPEAQPAEDLLQIVTKEESGEEVPQPMTDSVHPQAEAMEKTMNHGMEFLAGLFKMTTGKDIGLENQKVEVDRKSGEIVMRFKLPKI